MSEGDLRSKFMDLTLFPKGSVIFVEPRPGIPPGQPDLCVGVGFLYAPVELKYGRNWAKELRPAQRGWIKHCNLINKVTFVCTLFRDESTDIVAIIYPDFDLRPRGVVLLEFEGLNLGSFSEGCRRLIIPHIQSTLNATNKGDNGVTKYTH